ncbi:MAG: hypothetical protein V4724_25450 [Pseudomonadota bacterium]
MLKILWVWTGVGGVFLCLLPIPMKKEKGHLRFLRGIPLEYFATFDEKNNYPIPVHRRWKEKELPRDLWGRII